MIITPKIRGFICTTAHPMGCLVNVNKQIQYVVEQSKNKMINNQSNQKLNVLVIGSSTGYGLASRIVASFGFNAQTIGVFYERSALLEKTGSAGWYNSAAFEQASHAAGIYAKSINGDAFSLDLKHQTLDLIKKDWDKVDLIIYSLAAPRRVMDNGTVYNSVLKPVNQSYMNKTIDINTGRIFNVEILPATEAEIEATVKVMGGEDLKNWIDVLHNAKALANNCRVVAYSYVGPEMTHQIYRNGTIGYAKRDLENTIKELDQFLLAQYNGMAMISVNKALVTQASAAIPVVPLYISLLYKVMKGRNIHEGCIEQMFRLFFDYLHIDQNRSTFSLDVHGMIRMDDLEMRLDVQDEVAKLWHAVDSDNVNDLADLIGYKQDFYRLFGFNFEGVDYSTDYNIDVQIPSLVEHVET